MFKRSNFAFASDPVWQKIVTLSLVLFFVFFADAILSAWVPGLIENSFESPIVMGFIMSFSSIVGLGTDLIFPQILKGMNFKKLLIMGIFLSILFSVTLVLATDIPFILIFLVSMVLWGIYY